jgi:hypothetical protein
MRKSKSKYGFRLEITGALLSLCAGLIGLGVDLLKIPSVAYLPVIFGFLITAAASLLKVELMERIDHDSRIQSLLNQIESEDLHKRGIEIVQECEYALENLLHGIIQGRSAELSKVLVERANHTRHLLQATHLAPNPASMYVWEDHQGTANYYQANIQALKRGVTIERLFLLWKKDVIDSNTGQVIDPRIMKIMHDHQDNGIEVFVTWLESLVDPESAEDFIIFDDEEVELSSMMTEKVHSRLLMMHKPVSIRMYKSRFAELKALGQPLSQLPSLPKKIS